MNCYYHNLEKMVFFSRKTINELVKVCSTSLFNLDYLEQYWKFEDK